jgi:hypothetical protein
VTTFENYRHHKAQIIFIPVEAGSPKEAHRQRPAPYQRNVLEPWKPRTRPPSKAERLARFIDAMRRQDQMVREMMRPIFHC